jgi:hypothetical protein
MSDPTPNSSGSTAVAEPAPTALAALSATIDTLTFFDKAPDVTFAQKITQYTGERLFCKALISEDTLIVAIDDVGPGVISVPAGTTINEAQVSIAYKGHRTEVATISSFTYNGGYLHLTAVLSDDEQNVALTLAETRTPMAADTGVPFGYVIVLDDNQKMQLRWIDEPVQLSKANVPTVARVRPAPPDVAGVSGPFGIDSP